MLTLRSLVPALVGIATAFASMFVSVNATSSIALGAADPLLDPLRWRSCDPVVVPWHASVPTTMSALRRAGVMGVQRRGDAKVGTLSLTMRDNPRGEVVVMVFDTAGRFIGASTEHHTASVQNTKTFIANTIGRLVVDGGRILRRNASSTDLRVVCNGRQMTLTIGIADDRPLVAFMLVMIESETTATMSD